MSIQWAWMQSSFRKTKLHEKEKFNPESKHIVLKSRYKISIRAGAISDRKTWLERIPAREIGVY